ncbi:MAG: ATP-binding protein, partial [Bacteroidales bacterium]|nr:ATP-binding protein [Bacteroidales bacterium]
MINLEKISEYKENNQLELKLAQGRDGRGAIPASIWETYSAFANTDGGLILLGVNDNLEVVGIANPEKLVQDFWNLLNSKSKVNRNILMERNVKIEAAEGKKIISITVPRAERSLRPIFLGKDP